MSNLFDTIEANLKQADKRIVFPEGYDGRILAAADRLSNAGILTPILLGNAHDIKQKADEAGANISQCELLNPNDAADFDEMVEVFVDRRKGKVTADEAKLSSVTKIISAPCSYIWARRTDSSVERHTQPQIRSDRHCRSSKRRRHQKKHPACLSWFAAMRNTCLPTAPST